MDSLYVYILVITFFFLQLWAIVVLAYVVLDQRKENKALRKELARYTKAQNPEWVAQLGWSLFDDMPSDPRMGALN